MILCSKYPLKNVLSVLWVAAPLFVIVIIAAMGWIASGIIGAGSALLLILPIYIVQGLYERFLPKLPHRYRGMINGQEKDNSDHN